MNKLEIFIYIKSFFPDAIEEFKFLDDRRFRFDWYIPSKRCGIEYEGLISDRRGRKDAFSKTRHTSIKGYTKDCEKYTLASLNGYKVIRVTALNNFNDLNRYLKML